MSNKPKLVLIPSAQGTKFYSVAPLSGAGDFTFSRSGSATRTNSQGLIETVESGISRLNYNLISGSVAGCPHHIIEPQRTNLIIESQDYSDSGWVVFDATKEPNTITDPSDTNTGCRVTATSGSNKVIQQVVTVTADPSNARVYTGSIYIKSSNTTSCSLRVGDTTTGSQETITISDKWQRFDKQYTLGATFTSIRLGVILDNEDDVIDIAFGQVELGNYATSYIPTQGSIATRNAETCDSDFSSLPTVANTNTVLLKFIPMGIDTDFYELLRFSDGSNEIALEGFAPTNYDIYGSGLLSSGMVDGALSLNADSINTISFSYSGTSLRFSHNGSTIATTTPTGNLPTITEISHSVGGLNPIKIIKLEVYNDFKTQQELNSLTSL